MSKQSGYTFFLSLHCNYQNFKRSEYKRKYNRTEKTNIRQKNKTIEISPIGKKIYISFFLVFHIFSNIFMGNA